MNINSYTTLCAIGNNLNIEKFELSLPISNRKFDFEKIIPLPSTIKFDHATASESAIKKWKEWTTLNWGTPSNGFIENFRKVYSYKSDSFTIELSTVYNEPKIVLDKIIEKNPDLEFFIDSMDLFGNSYIAYRGKRDSETLILCSQDEADYDLDKDIEFEKSNISKLAISDFHHLHWDFLDKSYLGKQLKDNLLNIQQISTI
jgi:hypothetical protein